MLRRGQGGGRREKVVLATKVYGDMDQDPTDVTMKKGLSALKIRRACENSLKRLQTDYIDLYQMHHIRRYVTWDEIWEAYETLVRQGKVIYAGSSNFGTRARAADAKMLGRSQALIRRVSAGSPTATRSPASRASR